MKTLLPILVVAAACGIIATAVLLPPNDSSVKETNSAQLNEAVAESITITAHAGKVHSASTTPADPDGKESSWTYSDTFVVPEDMKVARIDARVNGAPTDVLHHLSLVKNGTSSPICGARGETHKSRQELYTVSRSNVREPIEFQAPYYLPLAAGDELVLEFMEHTRNRPYGPGGTHEDVSLSVELTAAAADRDRTVPLRFIRPRLDDTPCAFPIAHQAFRVPVQDEPYIRMPQAVDSATYTFNEPGTILTRSANVWPQKGGQELRVVIDGEVVDRFSPRQLDDPWSFLIPQHDEPIRVAKGERLAIEAVYDNPYETPILDASGIFGFYFAADGP